jgi:hypothetical protein
MGTNNPGMLCLAVWLIAKGALALFHVTFANTALVLAAIVAGVLILLGRLRFRFVRFDG